MLCRVVPPIVARHPEILSFPKPTSCTKHVKKQHLVLKRRIAELVEHKIFCGELKF